MTELREIEANEYDVMVNERMIGQVWNWHGSWSAKVDGKTYHGLKSRKEAITRVERTHRSKR